MARIYDYHYNAYLSRELATLYKVPALSGPVVELDEEDLDEIHEFAITYASAKLKESGHAKDYRSEIKRISTGLRGERAVECFLNAQFIDWTIGDSKKYHKPDLSPIGLRVGVKTVEFGSAPIIFKQERYPEIIVLYKDTERKSFALICGLASKAVLNSFRNQDINSVKDIKLRQKGTKTAFRGFDKLDPFENLEQLKWLVEKYRREEYQRKLYFKEEAFWKSSTWNM